MIIMENGIVVFVITLIGSFILFYGVGALIGNDNIEFIYLLLFIIQFSFVTTILLQILQRVKRLEEKNSNYP